MSIKRDNMDIIDDDNYGKILKLGKYYGKNNYGNGSKVSIEYGTSNFESIIYGDSLARIMEFSGYNVTREYFVSNNSIDISKIKDLLNKYRVNFDKFINDDFLYDNSIVDMAVDLLKKSDKCYIDNDELWLNTSSLYDSENRLLIDAEGMCSDFLLYLSYHIHRFYCGYDIIIDILSSDNCDYIDGIKSGIVFAGYDSEKLEIIKANNSKNKINNNINDVNEARCFFIAFQNVKKLYDIEKAYSKICLLIKGKGCYLEDKCGTIISDGAYIILNKLTQFDNICINASLDRRPNIIFDYLYELAHLFNSYYDDNTINDNCVIMILTMIRIVMDNSANILGLILREKI